MSEAEEVLNEFLRIRKKTWDLVRNHKAREKLKVLQRGDEEVEEEERPRIFYGRYLTMAGSGGLKPSTRFEYYNTNDDGYQGIPADPDQMIGQTFTTTADYYITKVYLKVYRIGSPGNLTVSIRETSEGKPLSDDLTSRTVNANTYLGTTAEWKWFSFAAPALLEDATMYAIVFRIFEYKAGEHYVNWRRDGSDPTYAGGTGLDSTTGGSTWVIKDVLDHMFETWGSVP